MPRLSLPLFPQILVIFTLLHSPSSSSSVTRQLLLFSPDDSAFRSSLFEALCGAVVADHSLGAAELPLKPEGLQGFHLAAFSQADVTMGRKQVVPLLLAALQGK